MEQVVITKETISPKEKEMIRHNVTDVLADALAKAIAKQIINSIAGE